jgi:hypothetical protein
MGATVNILEKGDYFKAANRPRFCDSGPRAAGREQV